MIVRMKGVKRVRAKGHVYYYHRKTLTRLPGEPGTTEFMDALRNLDVGEKEKAKPGTLSSLVTAYRSSPEFTGLADRTRFDYQKVFDYLKPLDQMPVGQIESGFLYALRDKANAKRKRRFANYLIEIFRLVFNWGMRRGHIDRNPALAVELVCRPRNAPWSIGPGHLLNLKSSWPRLPGNCELPSQSEPTLVCVKRICCTSLGLAMTKRHSRSANIRLANRFGCQPTSVCEQFLTRSRGLARSSSLEQGDGHSRRTAFSVASLG